MRSCVLALALLLTVEASALFAQTAEITGQVTDSTGAAVPGATITVKNVSTAITKTTTTRDQGYYTVPLLNTGSYEVAVGMAGFKSITRSNITLEIAQVARIDFVLEVGQVREQVTISSEAPLLQTEKASMAQLIGEKSVVDLPLNGRVFTQLALLTPGALDGGMDSWTRSYSVRINGMRTSNTVYLTDGVSTANQTFSGTPMTPPPDAIQEFKVQTNNLPAEYGQGGGVINVELKSGTNEFHGSGYEFVRNDKLDARNFFSKGKAPLRQNQFGGTIGGRIIRNRTFFFVDYEGTRVRRGLTMNSVQPTAAMREGDFSGVKQITDPTTGAPFPGNRIPADRISKQAAYFLPFLPAPNTPGGTYLWTASSVADGNQFDIRIDHQIRSTDSLKASYSFQQPYQVSPGALPQNGGTNADLRFQRFGLTELHTFGPSLINEFRVGYFRTKSLTVPQGLGKNYAVESGIGGLAQTSALFPGFPGVSISGYTSINANNWTPIRFREPMFEWSDSLSWIRGAHSFKTGFYSRSDSLDSMNAGYSRGNFNFTGTYTKDGFGDFLLGAPYSGNRSFPRDLWGTTVRNHQAYFQDDWKVTRRLTLNLGLRYELNHPPTFLHNQLSTVDFRSRKIIVASDAEGNINTTSQGVTQFLLPLFSDVIVPASKAGYPLSTLRDIDPHSFAPRLGAAIQLSRGFVVRAGYGILYSLEQGNQFASCGAQSPPFAGDELSNYNTTPVPSKDLTNFFLPFTTTGYRLSPLGFYDLARSRADQYFQQWNLVVQRAIAGAATVEVAYVGNKGTKMPFSSPENVPLPGPGVIQDRRDWTRFGSGSYLDSSGNSNYQGLQSKVEIRSRRGLSLLATHTWAKSIDNQSGDNQGSGVQDPNNVRAEKARSAWDVRQQVNISSVYALPFLRERRDLLGRAFGGWNVSNILTMRTGSAFTPGISTDPANTGRSMRPDRIGSGRLSNPSIDRWFDISAFRVPALYSYGNSGRTILDNPGLVNWDFGLLKDFRLSKAGERRLLQFRAEFFNFTNTAHFGGPVSNIQSATVGRILSAGNPREVQLALKLRF